MKNKFFIFFSILLFFCCSDSTKKYENEVSIVFEDLQLERKDFLKTYFAQCVKQHADLKYDKLPESNVLDEYMELENAFIYELNNINTKTQNISLIKYNNFRLNQVNLLSSINELVVISNSYSNWSIFISVVIDFLLELLVTLIILIIIVALTDMTLKSELFKILFSNWFILVVIMIISFFLKPAERMNLINSDIDTEIESKIEDIEIDLMEEFTDIKEKNIQQIENYEN